MKIEDMKKYWLFIIVILLLVASGILLLRSHRKNNNTSPTDNKVDSMKTIPVSEEVDPMKTIDCEFSPDLHYWNYWVKDYDYGKHTWQETKTTRQGDYYISCGSAGSAQLINAYVFKDYKLFFKQEMIFKGRFFADRDNNFYIIEGIGSSPINSFVSGFILTKYKYDSQKDTLVKTETTEYKTKGEIEKLHEFEKKNNPYFAGSDGYDFYKSMEDCLANGGRLPGDKNKAQEVSSTEIIKYTPPEVLPKEIVEGDCWESIAAPYRTDAFRCAAGNIIYDPCFSLSQTDKVICPIDPRDTGKDLLIKLTKPLREPQFITDKPDYWAWFVELEDGRTCEPYTGEAPIVDGKRINYSCGIMGDLIPGKPWTAKLATYSMNDDQSFKLDSVETVSIRKIWQ